MVPIGIPRPVLFAVKFAVCPLPSSVPPSCGEVSPTTVSPENDVAVKIPVTTAPVFVVSIFNEESS